MRQKSRSKQGLFAGIIFLAALPVATLAQLRLAPELEAVGPVSQVPVAIQNLRWRMLDSDVSTLTFRNMDTLFTTRQVSRAGKVSKLPHNDQALDFTYVHDAESYTPAQFLDRSYTNALLIAKNGRVVYENYLNNTDEHTRFIGWSMTKSLISLLIGVALEDGRIDSLDDDITVYLPELENGAYNGATIRQILQMRSGVDYEERYDFANPGVAASNHIHSLVKNVTRFVDAAKTIKRKYQPGEVFEYKTLDTAVLGLLLERVSASGNLSSYMSQHLWEPLGAEADGFFIMDGEPGVGREFSGAGFNATLRDFARVGLLVLNEGRFNDQQIIPSDWIKESTQPAGDEQAFMDYGYQWWTVSGTNAFVSIGLQGQFIYIDPDTDTVIVKLSYFPPLMENDSTDRETFSFFQAASAWQPAQQ